VLPAKMTGQKKCYKYICVDGLFDNPLYLQKNKIDISAVFLQLQSIINQSVKQDAVY